MSTIISLITALYNCEKEIDDLVDNVNNQTDIDFEWVLVDGRSADRTIEKLKEKNILAKHTIISEADFGIYDALNKGIKKSQGEYYIVLGADDRLDRNCIKNFKTNLSPEIDILAANITASGKLVPSPKGKSWLYGQRAFISAHSVGTLFRKSLHDKVGYYSRKFPIAADQLFVKKAVASGANLKHADFISGEFSSRGVSSVDGLGSLTEFYRVQVETEGKGWCLQTCLFILRLIKARLRGKV